MDGLRDIAGLHEISWWPLAFGWWIVVACLVIALAVGVYFLYKQFQYYRSWRGRSFRTLVQLERNLDLDNLKSSLQQLSCEIRQIAMQTSSRSSCAGLTARNWLNWLQAHDPLAFHWENKGMILISDQYGPAQSYDIDQIKEIISATKAWVRK